MRQPAHHGNRAERAVIHTVAKADAGEPAALRSSGDSSRHDAASIAVVIIPRNRDAVAPLTQHARHQPLGRLRFHAHNPRDFRRALFARGRAAVRLRVAPYHGLSKAVAAGITARAAVRAAQTRANLFDALVDLHVKLLPREIQNQPEHDAQYAQHRARIQNHRQSGFLLSLSG